MRLKIIIEAMLYDTISGNCESLIINFQLKRIFSGLRNLGVIPKLGVRNNPNNAQCKIPVPL